MKLLESLFRFYTLVGRKAPRFSTACLFCTLVLYIVINSSMVGIMKAILVSFFFLWMMLLILAALEADLEMDSEDR